MFVKNLVYFIFQPYCAMCATDPSEMCWDSCYAARASFRLKNCFYCLFYSIFRKLFTPHEHFQVQEYEILYEVLIKFIMSFLATKTSQQCALCVLLTHRKRAGILATPRNLRQTN